MEVYQYILFNKEFFLLNNLHMLLSNVIQTLSIITRNQKWMLFCDGFVEKISKGAITSLVRYQCSGTSGSSASARTTQLSINLPITDRSYSSLLRYRLNIWSFRSIASVCTCAIATCCNFIESGECHGCRHRVEVINESGKQSDQHS